MTRSRKQPACILHLSDLHFGMRFQPDKWEALKNKAKELAPDLVVITGDLVNTPWRWMVAEARRHLGELVTLLQDPMPVDGSPASVPAISPSPGSPGAPQSSAQSEGVARATPPPREIWVVPGNHDTRITGLVPVQWLVPITIAALVLAVGTFLLDCVRPPLPSWAYWIVLVIAALFLLVSLTAAILRLLVCVDLKNAWGEEHFLTQPRCSSRVPIGIVPFDSASQGVSWARGRISNRSLATFRAEIPKTNPGVTWIAAVHHHPLPLPYDHRTESMMAMDNAGAFLSELSREGIRLVLHGHKHHQHFARILIDPTDPGSAEIAVLSAGTPTSTRDPGAFWHGFNVITVHSDEHIQIKKYEAPPGGASFNEKPAFDLAPPEEQDHRRHLKDRGRLKVCCDRMLCIAEINAYGDARFYREFRDVCTELPALTELAGPYTAGTSKGLVESYRARAMSSYGPQVNLRAIEPRTRGQIKAALRFLGSGLQQGERPIDFAFNFFANNAFALNRWQFQCMYPDRPDDTYEYIRFSVMQDLAVRELTLYIRFPEEIVMPTRIDIREGFQSGDEIVWRALSPQCLVRMESQRSVQARIPYPRLGSSFEINWEPLANTYPKDGTANERDIRRALELRRKFGLLKPDGVPQALIDLISSFEVEARGRLGESQDKAFDVALFVFHEEEKTLTYLTGSYKESDPRRKGRYEFGLGVPGRAFKTASLAAFRKPAYSPDEDLWGYLLPDGRWVTDRNQVPEAVILAIPLAPPNAPDWPYGVLQLSTDEANRPLKTADTPSDDSVQLFCEVARGLTTDFEDILREAGL